MKIFKTVVQKFAIQCLLKSVYQKAFIKKRLSMFIKKRSDMRRSLNICKATLVWYILYTFILYSINNYVNADHHYVVRCGDCDGFVTESFQLRGPHRFYTWYFSNSGHLVFVFRRKFIGKRVLYCASHTAHLNLFLLTMHGDVHPNPGPRHDTPNAVNTSQHDASLPSVACSNTYSSLSVFYANARSIVNKRNLLNLELATSLYDIIILTETHLDNTIADREIFPRGYTVFRRDRELQGRHGGGILIATRDPIKAFPRSDLPTISSELHFVDIVLPKRKKLTLGVFYRPPNNDLKPLEDLKLLLNEISQSDLILVGDFNRCSIDWSNVRALENSAKCELLLDIVQDNFLTQLVKSPTRENNIMDLVLVTSPDIIENVSVGAPFPDHNSITFSILDSPYERRESHKLYYSYANANWAKLRDLLCYIPWHCAFLDDESDNNWTPWSGL